MIKTGVVHGRFQVMHLKHMEYILAAKMRCDKLYIGLTNPDSMHTKDSINDINRSEPSANPLTYFERYEIIRGAMAEFNVPESQYDILPFPINYPEYISQYVPRDAVHFLGIYDAWDEEKYKILQNLGFETEILWKRSEAEKGVTSSWIRSCIATGEEWEHLVPKSVYRYLTENELDKRIGWLEQMRIDEKRIIVPQTEEADEEVLEGTAFAEGVTGQREEIDID
ncbi:nicotinate-nucleotide adenylyltransferase [Merdimonas faecis]